MRNVNLLIALVLLLVGCAAGRGIRIDGSSTVYPISLAMAEEYSILRPDVDLSVSVSGTGGGISKLCAGELDVANASRVIRQSELQACAEGGIEVIELPVAADAITVVVNVDNDWAQCLTLAELSAIWEAGSDVDRWSEVRPGWPDAEIVLYGPGTDSGTFEYFTEAVTGEAGAIRTDFFPSEDDNVLVQGVQGDTYALGYFGFAYYAENQGLVRAVAIDGGLGCTTPSAATIESNEYAPLSRPLFVYVAAGSAERGDVSGFVRFHLSEDSRGYIAGSGYAAYEDAVYEATLARFDDRVTGSAFQRFEPGDSVLEAVRGD